MSTVTQIQPMPAQCAAPAIAPRPQSIAATGLSLGFLSELTEKHLFEGGVLTMRDLVVRMALSGPLLEEILAFLRKEGRIEVRSQVNQTRGEPIPLNYRVAKGPQGWKIYDINVLGAWLVETYKGTFASEISKGGIDGLIKALTEKNQKLASKPLNTAAPKK